jgi:hypothetical protein
VLAPPKLPPHDELEALIKEARARQRRRQATAAAVVAFASAAAFIGYSLANEHTTKSQSNSPRRGASSPAAACRRGIPRLLLSSTFGPPGTAVSVTGCGCTHPYAQADTLAWHNARSLREIAKRPPVSVWRRVPLVRTSRTRAQAVFVVRTSDPPGKGLLDMFCGPASNGNAIGYFTVTR